MKTVEVSPVDPVKEAVQALNDGVEQLFVNFENNGKTETRLGAVNDYPYILNSGLKTVVAVLETNTTCKVLELRGNAIGGGVARTSAVKKLAKALEKNTTLEVLDLSFNELVSSDLCFLAEALKVNKTLKVLKLENNRIGNSGLVSLARVLRGNHSLTTLRLDHNLIYDDGAEALGKTLQLGSKLSHLSLSYNSIRDRGAKGLLRSLMSNENMIYLGLAGNKINCRGAKYCSELFSARKDIRSGPVLKLSINHNHISHEDYKLLELRAKEANCMLVSLLYCSERTPKPMKAKITSFLSKDRFKAVCKGYQKLHFQDGEYKSYFQKTPVHAI